MATALNPLNPLQVPRESLRPPSSDSPRTGVAMSVLAHALLVAGLTLGVQWRANDEPDGVEAELWSAVPQLAAPRPDPPPEPDPQPTPPTPAPPPPPPEPVRKAPAPPPQPTAAEREAEIATERAERLKREKERQEAEDKRAREKREQAEKDKKAQAEKERQERAKAEQEAQRKAEQEAKQKAQQAKAAEQKRLQAEAAQREKLRQEQIQRMQAQLGNGAPDAGGTATRSSGPSATYAGRIKARIKPNIVLTEEIPGNPSAEVEVRVAVDGTIMGRRILKSSGSAAWDDAVLRALDRTGTLPRDVDGRVQPVMVITFRPLE